MKRLLFFAYGLTSYVIFLGTFLYAIAFVGGFGAGARLDGPLKTSPKLQQIYAAVRARSPHFTADRYWADEMSSLQSAVLAGEIGAEGVGLG